MRWLPGAGGAPTEITPAFLVSPEQCDLENGSSCPGLGKCHWAWHGSPNGSVKAGGKSSSC